MYEVKEEQFPEAAAVPREVTSLGEAATNLVNDARVREI